MCFKYFYNDGRLDYKDYADTFVDGRDDGGIDLITTSEDDNQDHLVMIQGKSTTKIGNKQDVVDVFTKMDQTFRDFQDHKTAQYNPRLKRIFKEKMALLEEQAPIYELVLFINANPDEKRRVEINSEYGRIDELGKYQITTIYRNQIIEQIKNVNDPQAFVPEGKIKIAKGDGVIKFGENGLLVNLTALSLKDLYDRFRDKGLFEQNFRYSSGINGLMIASTIHLEVKGNDSSF